MSAAAVNRAARLCGATRLITVAAAKEEVACPDGNESELGAPPKQRSSDWRGPQPLDGGSVSGSPGVGDVLDWPSAGTP